MTARIWYFTVSAGLRGCYTPDRAYVVKAATRRELKVHLDYEARDMRDAGFVGGSKRAVARLAADCWRNRDNPKWTLDLCVAMRRDDQPGNWAWGLFVSRATPEEFAAYVAEQS